MSRHESTDGARQATRWVQARHACCEARTMHADKQRRGGGEGNTSATGRRGTTNTRQGVVMAPDHVCKHAYMLLAEIAQVARMHERVGQHSIA